MSIISSLLNNLNYSTIFLLMLLESTVVPVPSELVVAPAAYHSAGGNLNVILVVFFATIGADVGASINYFVALYVGRPVIYRFANSKLGKMCLLNQDPRYQAPYQLASWSRPHELLEIFAIYNDWCWLLARHSCSNGMVYARHCSRRQVGI